MRDVFNTSSVTPYIPADKVFEIDKGTRVLTHSPDAIHKRHTEKSMTRNTSDTLPFVRERLGTGQRLTAPEKLGWNNLGSDECGPKTREYVGRGIRSMIPETGNDSR